MVWLPLSAYLCLMVAQDPVTSEPRWEDLHPALRITQPELEQLWDRGYKDAEKKPDPKGYLKPIHRELESIRGRGAVSWAWLMNPEMLTYMDGFYARKQYLPEDEKASNRTKSIESGPGQRTLRFSGLLSAYPAFGRGGTVSRMAKTSDLENVRVVLKIGERIYQPTRQPGKLQAQLGRATNIVEVTDFSTAYIPGEKNRYGKQEKGTTATVTTTSNLSEGYAFYEAQFQAEFDLFERDGTPRIGTKEKEFTLIVIYGEKEKRAIYKLADLAKMRR